MEHPRIGKETRKKQERGNHEPLVSLKRPGSAEQVQFFSVFRSNGGKQEATVRCESRLRGGVEKKDTCAPQNRRNLLRFSDKQRQVGSEHEEWVTHGRRSTKKERWNQLYPVPTPIIQANFSPNIGGDYNKHGFMSRQHFLQRNVTSKHILVCERNL